MAKRRTQGGPERGRASVSAQTKRKIERALKNTSEQKTVVGPLVARLLENGWNLDQIIYGKREWRVPKSPSEATKREKHESFSGFPVDIAVFDDPVHTGDPRHLLFVIECKQPTEDAGVAQLESYFVGEPRAQLGVWANDPEPSARSIFVYRDRTGRIIRKSKVIADIPRSGEAIRPDNQRRNFRDLTTPTDQVLKKTVSDLLDKVVVSDTNVTRREDQLDQLCNLLLLKLESDREAKSSPDDSVFFRNLESPAKTASAIRERYREFVELYPGVFLTEQDKVLRLSDQTIDACVELLASLRLIDLGVTAFALAFQVLRSEALKQGEGQYFTPQPVIEAGVRLMKIAYSDLILDPACGTGGFLVQAMLELKRKRPRISDSDLSRWAQTHLFGIDKDAIGVKLAKAAMQIAGDGSARRAWRRWSDPAASHSSVRKSTTMLAKSSGRSRCMLCAHPGTMRGRESVIPSHSRQDWSGTVDQSWSPQMTSVGAETSRSRFQSTHRASAAARFPAHRQVRCGLAGDEQAGTMK